MSTSRSIDLAELLRGLANEVKAFVRAAVEPIKDEQAEIARRLAALERRVSDQENKS